MTTIYSAVRTSTAFFASGSHVRIANVYSFGERLFGAKLDAHLPDVQFDDLISAVLRGEVVSWLSWSAEREQAFLRRCEYHGVAALLVERCGQNTGCPQATREGVRRIALSQAIWELRHKHVLSQLIAALAKFNIAPIFFKGTALAYDLYENPVWRARSDTDLIVHPSDVATCREVLLSQGFKRGISIPGDLVSYQESWTLPGTACEEHSIDLHRRICNSELLSRLFSYEELRDSARPLPMLCPGALGAGHVHALLLACMHRVTHKGSPYYTHGVAHYSGNRLIWLYDIHLLARRLDLGQWDTFVRTARAKGLGTVCLDGFEAAASCFNTSIPETARVELARCPENRKVAAYFKRGSAYQQLTDFRAISGIYNKLRFISQTIFPHADYMRWKYPNARLSFLPVLYTRRVLAGLSKRLRNVRAN
jgi:hypothetical protein